MSRTKRALLAAAVGIATAFVVVVPLAIADLYLSGHGRPTLSRPIAGTAASWADLVLLASVALAAIGTWRVTKPRGER